jgi:Mn2+/Fe2+ NRAMP family transporter
MSWEFSRRGQNLVDLALIIGVVGLVVVGMQTYIQRSVQRKVKDLTDYIISDQQSTSADEVPKTSTLISDSTTTSEEFTGGGRRFTVTEDSTTVYHP